MAVNTAGMSANAAAYYAKTKEDKLKTIQQSATPQAQQSHYNSAIATAPTTQPAPVTGMGPTASPTPTGYQPPAAGSQASHQAYIDKTMGGMSSYTANQQTRYDQASASGDQDLLGKLNADASRVGYAFKPYQAPVSMPNQPQLTGYTAPQDAVTSVRNSSQLQQESGDSLAIERAALKNAIDTTMQGLRNNASYTNKLITDSRVLQDFERSQTVSPFKGKTSYDTAMIGRGRDIDDSARGANLDNELNSYTQEMMNFDRLAPERQRQILAELLEKERNFGLNVADRTGNYAGERTLAGSAQDYAQNPNNPSNTALNIQNKIAQLDLDSYPEQIKLGLDALKQEVETGKLTQQEAEIKLKELQDPNSFTNRAKELEFEMAELEAKNLPETQRLELQKLRKQIADIGVTHYKPQTAAEKEYAEQQVVKIKAEIAKINGGSAEAPKLNTALANSLKSTYSTKNNITGQETLDKTALRSAIIASLNTDEEIDQMLGYFGLPINQ